MGLTSVVSAMREVIVREIDVPTTLQSRRWYFADLFPQLNPEDIEELAQVSRRRFRIYRQVMFDSEGKFLVRSFPATFALLSHTSQARCQQPPDPACLVENLHQHRLWTDGNPMGLAASFVDYLSFIRTDLQRDLPELADICLLEYLSLKLETITGGQSLRRRKKQDNQLKRIAESELLNLRYVIPFHVIFATFSCDVVSFHSRFLEGARGALSSAIAPGQVWTIGGRAPDGRIIWHLLPQDIYDYLRGQKRAVEQAVKELAELFSKKGSIDKSSQDGQVGQTQSPQRLIHSFKELLESGVIMLGPTQGRRDRPSVK